MENKYKNQEYIGKGFKEPLITPDNYILGGGQVPQVILQEDSDWTENLPTEEPQLKSTETWNCTAFGMTNAIEILMFRLFGERHNYSDRFVGIMAGTKEGGNDPHTVCEAIRKHGLIPEEMLPFSDDITTTDEYYSFKGGDKDACIKTGQDWLKEYDFKHEYVFSYMETQPKAKIVEALKFSPLGVSLFAWTTDDLGIYINPEQRPNHWTVKYGFDKEFNELSKIFDSYDPYRKITDQDLMYVKRFHIAKKNFYPERQGNWLLDILTSLWNFIRALFDFPLEK